MSINLKNCKEGTELITRDGKQVLYSHRCVGNSRHVIKGEKVPSFYVRDDGKCFEYKTNPLDIVAFAVISINDADIFSNLPEEITEVVYKGERYKKLVVTTWVKA